MLEIWKLRFVLLIAALLALVVFTAVPVSAVGFGEQAENMSDPGPDPVPAAGAVESEPKLTVRTETMPGEGKITDHSSDPVNLNGYTPFGGTAAGLARTISTG